MTASRHAAAESTAAGAGTPRPFIGFVLSHEQFPAPELVALGAAAERAGFDMIWTSDHFQPWQANQGHGGQAWLTLSALSQQVSRLVMGTGVTTPTLRYRPALVAQAFASLSLFAPGRVFLGLGTGEKLNEAAAGGEWPLYPERAARLVEAVEIMRRLWTGDEVDHAGRYYHVQGRLYDTPPQPIPLYIAAGGPKSARLSGEHGDGLVADPNMLKTNPAYKTAWEEGARAAGKDAATMPILLEHMVCVGDQAEAERTAELWRFLPKAWQPGFFNELDPRRIQQRAEQTIPLDQVAGQWAVGTDPADHVKKLQEAVDRGATHIFVHSAQADQRAVIEFFGRHVLPAVRDGAISGTRTTIGFPSGGDTAS